MSYSRLNEEDTVRELFNQWGTTNKVFVDIGCGNGQTWSNTLGFLKDGWRGRGIDADDGNIAAALQNWNGLRGLPVGLRASPDNICSALVGIPANLDYLSLDIDGYDYFILEAILKGGFLPTVVCLEINPTIPPPFKFTVLYDPDYHWGVNEFYGQSLSAADELLRPHGYELYKLCVDNAIFTRFPVPELNIKEEYRRGFLDNPHHDSGHFEFLKSQSRSISSGSWDEGLRFIEKMWAAYAGKFKVWL